VMLGGVECANGDGVFFGAIIGNLMKIGAFGREVRDEGIGSVCCFGADTGEKADDDGVDIVDVGVEAVDVVMGVEMGVGDPSSFDPDFSVCSFGISGDPTASSVGDVV